MKQRNAYTTVELLIVIGLAVLLFVALIGMRGGCTDPQGATRLLEQQGYKNIHITGYRLWIKGRDDTSSTGFEATAPNGDRVTGAVTSGIGKGKTVRFD